MPCVETKVYLTVRSLPNIERELKKLLEKINEDLERLPSPPSSAPLRDVLRLVTEFTRAVERQGEGIPGRDGLLQQIRLPQEEFRVAIRKTAPCFIPRFSKRHTGAGFTDGNTVGPQLYPQFHDLIPNSLPQEEEEEELYSDSPPGLFEVASVEVMPARVPEPSVSFGGPTRPGSVQVPYGGHVSGRARAPEPVRLSGPTRVGSVQVPEDGHNSRLSEDGNAPKPPFLIGEEKEDEVGLSDGKSIFIDDVLENAERCVLLKCSHGVYPHSEKKTFD